VSAVVEYLFASGTTPFASFLSSRMSFHLLLYSTRDRVSMKAGGKSEPNNQSISE